ncbi:hypothetical protein PISMIDRAFT_236062 [Pisolithus microcarpus 441]|uniref:Unplaced genomic scaffold scaffold_154, whole genome shotgun sequence n=1 Tax=Pisolithus microcarpus 441 TaxID=765257 RepID=A0A0C9YSX5_9AGAM|nr:hypothetical protein PISMIDRAFT_236062 [Pisolithus microcarpus 441]
MVSVLRKRNSVEVMEHTLHPVREFRENNEIDGEPFYPLWFSPWPLNQNSIDKS